MGLYHKKPVVIEAVQLCWRNWTEVCDLVLGPTGTLDGFGFHIDEDEVADKCGEMGPYIGIKVTTIDGNEVTVYHGAWVAKEPVPNRFYPIHPDVFRNTYEKVEDEDPPQSAA